MVVEFERCPHCDKNEAVAELEKFDGLCLKCWNERDLELIAAQQQQKKEN